MTNIITGFKARRPTTGRFKPIKETGIYNANGRLLECTMRPTQREVFDKHKNEGLCIISKPPGAGKSTTVRFVHGHDLLKNDKQKLIISVPQTVIAKTFRQVVLKFPDGTVIHWDVGTDLCENTQDSKVQAVVDFIRKKKFASGIHERILLCTHASLAYAYDRVQGEPGLKSMLVNTTVVVDEAHHVLNVALNGEGESVDVRNKLGEFVHYLLRNEPRDYKIWLLTATFFRGDRLSILSEEDNARFGRFYLPLDKHWRENFKHIETYSFDFVTYNGESPFEEVKSILDRQRKKTIIYCPPANNAMVTGTKKAFVERLKKAAWEAWPGANILDLVDEDGRHNRKEEQLMDEEAARSLDVIVAVNMMNEGADLPLAEQILDLSPSNSLRVLVQRFGRIIRDVPGKKHLNYYMFLPFQMGQMDRDDHCRLLNNNFAAFTASLLLEDCIQPVILKKKRGKSRSGTGREAVNYFQEAVPDENERREVLQSVIEQLLLLKGSADAEGRMLTNDEKQHCIEQALADFGIDVHLQEIVNQVVAILRRRTIQYGEDVSWMVDAGFEKIWVDDIFDSLWRFVSGSCGVRTFEDFRRIYERENDLRWENNHQGCLRWAKKHNTLPSNYSDDPDEVQLGLWIGYQRHYYKNTTKYGLSEERQAKCEQIPGWVWSIEDPWDDNHASYLDFVKINGKPPSLTLGDAKQKFLDRWAVTQRRMRKRGDLSESRQKQCESIPGWFWEPYDPWGDNFNIYCKFISLHRRLPVSKLENPEESRIGRWAVQQRADRGAGKLSVERQKLLESTDGWMWDMKNEKWIANLKNLKAFVAKYRRIPVEEGKLENEHFLSRWIGTQRRMRKRGDLSESRQKQCESIPGWSWEPTKDYWGRMFVRLVDFITENGHGPRQTSNERGERHLHRWMTGQKKLMKAGTLLQKRKKQLEGIAGWTWRKEDPFEDNFRTVEKWKKDYQKLPRLNAKDKIERRLGSWVAVQRLRINGKRKRARPLTVVEKAKLKKLLTT